jgi:hypothetical protein
MSDSRRDEATKCFAQLWGGDSNTWNHDQRMVAAGVYKLFLETTTITESDLMNRIDTLVNQNPETCAAERTSSNPGSVLTTQLSLSLYLKERANLCHL